MPAAHTSANAITILTLCATLVGGCGWGDASAGGTTGDATAGPARGPVAGPAVVQLAEASASFLTVEEARASERGAAIHAPGRVEFRDGALASVGAPVEGRVTVVHVRVGDPVRRGDPLVTLRSPAAAAARADLKRLVVAEDAARKAVARQKRMMEAGVGVPAEKLEAETHLAEIEAEVLTARKAVAFLGDEGGESVVVRAPIDGTVLEGVTAVGTSAVPGNGPLVEIGDPNALWVVADVFERDLARMAEGAAASVELASSATPQHGRVVAIGAVVRTALRAAPVYVALEREDAAALRPGMYARLRIESEAAAGVMLPSTAVLIKDGTRPVVYVETGERTFRARDVSVRDSVGGQVQILDGIEPGERVVVRGALLLDGAADQLL